MSLKIAICDDVSHDRQQLISFIKSTGLYCEIASYDCGEALVWDLESPTHFDIFFLDIFMNGMSGLEAARHIRNTSPDALLVFISSSDAFYRESYDLYAFNYLIKPVSEEKLTEVLRLAMERLKKDADQVIRVFFNNSLHTIRCSQLLYLSSNLHIVSFCLKNGQILKSYGKLDDFVMQLPAENFMRCHQSYIVNLNHVTAMTSDEFILEGISVPVSRKYSKLAHDKYRAQMFGDF